MENLLLTQDFTSLQNENENQFQGYCQYNLWVRSLSAS